MWPDWSPLRLWWRCVHSYRPWPIFTYPQGYSFYAQECIPTIILLSDCRKPEVFDIWNKLMLGKDIGIISVISYDKHITGKHSQNWEGVARSPPAERDHTRSIMCFPFCKLQEDVIKIVRTKLPSQSSLIYYIFSKTYLGFLTDSQSPALCGSLLFLAHRVYFNKLI